MDHTPSWVKAAWRGVTSTEGAPRAAAKRVVRATIEYCILKTVLGAGKAGRLEVLIVSEVSCEAVELLCGEEDKWEDGEGTLYLFLRGMCSSGAN